MIPLGVISHERICEFGNSWNTFDTGGVCSACLH